MKKYETIELELQDEIAILFLNRPQFLNAMNRQMMDEIIDALTSIVNDDSVRVGVITGKGKAFMAGADIKEYASQTAEGFKSFREKGLRLYQLIESAPIPFIAAVNGFALGGGFEIALACDMVVAANDAKMGLPEVHLGLIPGGGGIQRLLEKIGMNRIKEMLLLGNSYLPSQMQDWGIVNIIAPADTLMGTVRDLAEKLKRRPAQSLKEIKQLLVPSVVEQSFCDRLKNEGVVVFGLFDTKVARDLIKGFTEKNK